jgi:hypothetical protein
MKLALTLTLALALLLTGGSYVYTFATGGLTMGITEPTADIATCNATATQPDWDSILDDVSANITCASVPTGYLFGVTPNPEYMGELVVMVYLVNTANLTKAYQYLNIKLYLEGSAEAKQTPNYRLLTLSNAEVAFTFENLAAEFYIVEVIGGGYCVHSNDPFEWGEESSVTPRLYCQITQR